jgi:type IV secretory pathway VirB3-like protein
VVSLTKKKKKTEFSKKIFYIITTLTIIIVLYSMALMWYTQDSSALSYLIPAIFGELGVSTGFYYWKARTENKIKLEKKYKIKIDDTCENEELDDDIEL